MNRDRPHRLPAEKFDEVICAAFGARKHDRALDGVLRQQVSEQALFLRTVDEHHALRNIRHVIRLRESLRRALDRLKTFDPAFRPKAASSLKKAGFGDLLANDS